MLPSSSCRTNAMKRHKLIIDASYAHVRAACAWLHEALSKSISDEKLYELELATSEILTNIVKHAFDSGRPACRIHVAIDIHEDMLRILFIDNGKRMPGSLAKSLNDSEGKAMLPSDLDEGGRGIFLIKSCVDKVRYRRFGSNNIMLIVVGGRK